MKRVRVLGSGPHTLSQFFWEHPRELQVWTGYWRGEKKREEKWERTSYMVKLRNLQGGISITTLVTHHDFLWLFSLQYITSRYYLHAFANSKERSVTTREQHQVTNQPWKRWKGKESKIYSPLCECNLSLCWTFNNQSPSESIIPWVIVERGLSTLPSKARANNHRNKNFIFIREKW